MTFVLASNNLKKRREMGQILQAMGIRVLTMEEAGIHSEPEEDGSTFEENALIKARAACQAAGLPALADDSGLAVDALNGAPGIRSARYCPGTDRDRMLFLLKNMEQVPDGQRGAKFVSAVACVFPDGRELVCRGECPGQILREERGDGGFGYDPVFYVPAYGQTFSEMPQQTKNQISHRARAMEALADRLGKMLETTPEDKGESI